LGCGGGLRLPPRPACNRGDLPPVAGVPEPRREAVSFVALTKEQLAEIVELQLARLRKRLGERRISLEVTDEAKELLAEEGWDPAYGARPLKRAIQRLVENPLARELLEGRFAEGDTLQVDARDGELVFDQAVAAETAATA
jgi:ATP-dependent Clp protease ATP-binding subunit ClpB